MGESAKLLPCPFCGSPAEPPYNANKRKGSKNPRWTINCVMFCVFMRRGTKKECIADWNTRAEKQVSDA